MHVSPATQRVLLSVSPLNSHTGELMVVITGVDWRLGDEKFVCVRVGGGAYLCAYACVCDFTYKCVSARDACAGRGVHTQRWTD